MDEKERAKRINEILKRRSSAYAEPAGPPPVDLPKHGEVWQKNACDKAACAAGWSLGVGVYRIDRRKYRLSWGTAEQIRHGCLIKLLGA